MSARRLSVCATLLLFAVAASSTGEISSERVISQIEQLIGGQRGIRIYDWVGFSLRDRNVILEGAVTSPALKRAIERIVLALEAVDSVQNDLEVLPETGDDVGIRINAYWRIYGHPEIRRYLNTEHGYHGKLKRSPDDTQRVLVRPIHIVVRDAEITLEGEVEQHREKRVAEQQANAVLGVRAVTNNIVVTGADTEEFEPIDFETDPWWVDSGSITEPVLRVENPVGGVAVRVIDTERVLVRRSSRSRPVKASDTKTTRLGRKMRIRAQPSDGAPIDLEIDLPYGHRLEVETVAGPIAITGLVRHAQLETAVGPVELAVPWRAVRLEATSDRRPLNVTIPNRLRTSLRSLQREPVDASWTLQDLRDPRIKLYGSIRLDAKQPDALVLSDVEIGEDSPVRMHWQAPEAIVSMLRRRFRMRLNRPGGDGADSGEVAEASEDGLVRFNSDVRLVQLSASIVNEGGRPVTGLGPENFEILEDGAKQEIGIVQNTEAEFNLVLLLDCSTSTLIDRKAVLEAARRFVLTARPSDRVGIYVLSDSYVHVVSRLTEDRDALLRTIGQIPRLSGGTPLYDAITLSYAHELARRRWERNALIVISDGMDNDLLPLWSRSIPSEVPFEDLLRAAAEINSAIYPIFLEPEPPGVRTERNWRERLERSTNRARDRMQRLADTTGGRLFGAKSIRDLDTVYEQVAEELRSVYTLGYYPSNQEFDGAWRRIRVNVRGVEARVRTRPGYYGW
ncbi:MAG: VWA domain-containing protein [Bryobacterales bacterium]|nr:VWA domain-containing protein [Bryobacterales bacterium]